MRCMRVVPYATARVPAQGSSTSAKPSTLSSCVARAAGFCHPCFGSTGFSSSSLYPGRNPAHTTSQVGTSNWASRKVCSHSRTAVKLGLVHDVADHHLCQGRGASSFPLGMQSAQLAQWAASTLPAARHSPSPPKFGGTPAALRALSESPAIPTNWQKHVHSALSWACVNASDSGD